MPIRGPCAKRLSVENVIKMTQSYATTPDHRTTYLEIVRVQKIANSGENKRATEAQEFLRKLKHELLIRSEEIVVKDTHAYWPSAYFLAMTPRYMKVPEGPKSVCLRWKVSNDNDHSFTLHL